MLAEAAPGDASSGPSLAEEGPKSKCPMLSVTPQLTFRLVIAGPATSCMAKAVQWPKQPVNKGPRTALNSQAVHLSHWLYLWTTQQCHCTPLPTCRSSRSPGASLKAGLYGKDLRNRTLTYHIVLWEIICGRGRPEKPALLSPNLACELLICPQM